jgi:hypothetical protein
MSDVDQRLDLAKASGAELAEFSQRHGMAVDLLERCQQYLRTSGPIRAKFELLVLTAEPEASAVPAVVLRLVRDDSDWVEVPTDFPSEHLIALLEILDEC